MGLQEGEHHAIEQVRIPLLNVDAGSIDVGRLAMLSDRVVRGCLYPRLVERYQVGAAQRSERKVSIIQNAIANARNPR